MLYRIEQAFSGTRHIGDSTAESDHFSFNLARDVDKNYPAIIIIRATGVDLRKSRISLNDNFVGYLTSGKEHHFFEVDNTTHGALKKTANTVAALACDIWGDRKSLSNFNIDDLDIRNIDIVYKPIIPNNRTLAVALIAQGTRMWCWAASGQMIMKFLDHDVSQCLQANYRFNRTDCCSDPENCVTGGWPQFEHWGFSCQTMEGAQTFAQIKTEIDAGRPIAFSWHWPGGGGHMMALIGYNEANQMLLINDPWPPHTGGQRWITYNEYVSRAGHHTHWRDYYSIRYVGTGIGAESPVTEESMAQNILSPRNDDYADAKTAASEALKLLPDLVLPEGSRLSGDDDVGVSASASSLGEPFRVYYVHYDSLQQAKVDENVRELLIDGEEMFYPLVSDDGVVSSVNVALENDRWSFRSIGDSSLSEALEEVRNQQVSASGEKQADYFIVKIPTMYLIFVAHVDDTGMLMLTHVYDSDEFGFKKYETGSAESVLNAVLPGVSRAEPGAPPVVPF